MRVFPLKMVEKAQEEKIDENITYRRFDTAVSYQKTL